MANLSPTKIALPGSSYNRVDLNFFQYGTNVASTTYLHLKTNFPRYGGQMYMIEAIGYNYGRSQSIQCAFTGYMYNAPGTTIYNPTQFQAYTGLVADGQYLSSDDFLVLRFSSSDVSYAGFLLNCYQTNPIATTVAPQVTAVLHNTNSGAAF